MRLSDLLFLSADNMRVVSRLDDKNITQVEFMNRLSSLYVALQKKSESRWLLFSNDALEFSIALLALLCAGKKVVIAPNKQPGTLSALSMQCDMVFSAGDYSGEKNTSVLPDSFIIPLTAAISIATSGSSGTMKLIDKPLHTFTAEINNLEKNWGELVADAVFFATVSHQHIYGLLFRVLWPLRCGRIFMAHSHAYPEPLFDEMAQVGKSGRTVLVSSPAHLTRIPDAIDGGSLKKTLAAVFSSGGPLPEDAALNFAKRFDKTPIEIFGSTETGGVAFRQQGSRTGAIWRAFDDVDIKIDNQSGCLAIRSDYCYQQDWFLMGDQVDLLDERSFVHRGRVDRIIKLEEKRLSLTAMEQSFMQHPWVKDARLVVLASEGRQMLGAVLVLNAEAEPQLRDKGKSFINACLKKHLLENFERILLPRKWRYVTELPCNSQGKVLQQDLQDLFL